MAAVDEKSSIAAAAAAVRVRVIASSKSSASSKLFAFIRFSTVDFN